MNNINVTNASEKAYLLSALLDFIKEIDPEYETVAIDHVNKNYPGVGPLLMLQFLNETVQATVDGSYDEKQIVRDTVDFLLGGE